jgi:hypothetical protein
MLGTLFHEHWWLAAASGDEFQEVSISDGRQTIGRLPFVLRHRGGFRVIQMPPFSHLLGPIVHEGLGKPQTKLLRRLSMIRDLIDRLPRFDFFKQAIEVPADGLAFQERGFDVSLQYNFKIDCTVDPTILWDAMHFKTRQHIRRAREKFEISTCTDPTEFTRFYTASLQNHSRVNTLNLKTFPALYEACDARNCGVILCAHGPDKCPAAMIYLVWGKGVMYYLLSSRARLHDDNGSINLLIWSAIQRAHDLGLCFDLDGISDPGTAHFLSRFGGQMTSRLIVRRSTRLYSALLSVKRTLIGSSAPETISFT